MRISDWSSDVCSSDLPDRYARFSAPVIAAIPAGATGGGWVRRRIEGKALSILRLAKASLRSEEHTSELQSLMRISYAVFCLKKKKQIKKQKHEAEQNKSSIDNIETNRKI